MEARLQEGWGWRLVWSCAAVAWTMVLSTLLVLLFSSGQPSKFGDTIEFIARIPLLPGLAVVSLFQGSWQMFHQARTLVLVPLSSFVIDAALLFLTWEFLRRVRSRELTSETLHIK